MEVSQREALAPVPAVSRPTTEHSNGRVHLAKAFKNLLLVAPLAFISAFLSFIMAITLWGRKDPKPSPLCDLTDYCVLLSVIPIALFYFWALAFLPVLFTLDHFLTVSSTFHDKLDAEEVEPLNERESEEPTSSPSTAGNPHWARLLLGAFALVAYVTAILWAVASASAATRAALIIKYSGPLDLDLDNNPDPLFAWVMLVEAALDLSLVFLTAQQATLYTRARESIQPESQGTMQPTSMAAYLTGLRGTTFWDIWHGTEGLWDRRTAIDKAVLCLLVALGALTISIVRYGISDVPAWSYFSGGYYFLTAILIYPLLFIFHTYRTAGDIPHYFVRGFVCPILSFLALLWLVFSTSFFVIFAYGLSCDPHGQGSSQIPCRPGYGFLILQVAILDLLLAVILGFGADNSWKSGQGVQLQPASGALSDTGRTDADRTDIG